VVLLDGGRVVAEGTHDELTRTSERYRDVLAHSTERGVRRLRRPLVRGGDE
jgi:ABC-type multidrug transport system fused ATPase/permease subunit